MVLRFLWCGPILRGETSCDSHRCPYRDYDREYKVKELHGMLLAVSGEQPLPRTESPVSTSREVLRRRGLEMPNCAPPTPVLFRQYLTLRPGSLGGQAIALYPSVANLINCWHR